MNCLGYGVAVGAVGQIGGQREILGIAGEVQLQRDGFALHQFGNIERIEGAGKLSLEIVITAAAHERYLFRGRAGFGKFWKSDGRACGSNAR